MGLLGFARPRLPPSAKKNTMHVIQTGIRIVRQLYLYATEADQLRLCSVLCVTGVQNWHSTTSRPFSRRHTVTINLRWQNRFVIRIL